jgi:hypothetical protein
MLIINKSFTFRLNFDSIIDWLIEITLFRVLIINYDDVFFVMKRFLYYCPECKKVTLMTLLKEDKNTNTVFLKCLICSALESKKKPPKNGKRKLKEKKYIREYSPKESYKVGDSLYHKVFNDTGEVIKITKRFNGQIINTVLFPTAGVKKLITLAGK